MPNQNTVQAFVAMIERGETLEAIEAFYAPDASAQENGEAARRGKAVLIAYEKEMLSRMRIDRLRAEAVLIDGDRVAIRLVMELTLPGGKRATLDEVALQEWRDELIVHERYYYDPKQLRG